MSDLVLRLRSYADDVQEAVGENRLVELISEAANEVEQLQWRLEGSVLEAERLRKHVVKLEQLVDEYKQRWRQS